MINGGGCNRSRFSDNEDDVADDEVVPLVPKCDDVDADGGGL